MDTYEQVLARGVKIFTVIIAVLISTLYFCGYVITKGMCGSQVIEEIYSPDWKNKIVIFERDCGAIDGFHTHVSIVKSDYEIGSEYTGYGNVFRADGHPDWFEFEVEWINDGQVIIRYRRFSDLSVINLNVRGIRIQIQEVETDAKEDF